MNNDQKQKDVNTYQDSYQDNSFFIHQEKPDHHYRTEIPNIIFELPLDNFEFKLYCVIKKIAGDSGASWCSVKTLSEMSGMGERKVQMSFTKLQESFDEIGKPLIRVLHRKKENGDNDTPLIVIVDIWRENGTWNKSKIKSTGAQHAPPLPHGMHHPGAPHAPKEDPSKEDLKKTTTTEKEEVVVVLQHEEEKRKALSIYAFSESSIQSIIHLELKQILEGIEAFEKYRTSKKIENMQGCLIQAIKNAWVAGQKTQDPKEEESQDRTEKIQKGFQKARELFDKFGDKLEHQFSFKVYPEYVYVNRGKEKLNLYFLQDDVITFLKNHLKKFIKEKI